MFRNAAVLSPGPFVVIEESTSGGRRRILLGNRQQYCYPLAITDFAGRYLLRCEALLTTQEKFAFTLFERTFKEFWSPTADSHR